MFAYVPLEPKDVVFKADLKCNPDKSVELREKNNGITETFAKSYRLSLSVSIHANNLFFHINNVFRGRDYAKKTPVLFLPSLP